MKLPANNSYGYQFMGRSRYTDAKYVSDEKTHRTINKKRLSALV